MKPNDPTSLAAAILRITTGVVFIVHGLAKVVVYTLPGTAQFFEAVGFPGWTAYPVATLEIVGGLLLVAGVKVAWVAIALLPVVLGATKAHAPNGFIFSNANGGWEFPAFVAITLIAVALLSSGRAARRGGATEAHG